jgi:putative membrane protein
VKAGLRPYLIAAGVVLVVVAALSLLGRVRRNTGHDEHGDAEDDDGHGHGTGRGWRDVAWLLVVPMAVLLLISPSALGSYSASRSGTALGAASTSDFPPLPSGDPVRVSILDYASRAVFDKGQSLTGRQITLSGFLLAAPSGWYLTRMVITCCAADAQPIKVGLSGSVPAGLTANQWLEVTGRYSAKADHDGVNGETIPYLDVAAAHPIAAPKEQYDS